MNFRAPKKFELSREAPVHCLEAGIQEPLQTQRWPRYCWAEDSAVDSYGNARHNYVRIEYTRPALDRAPAPTDIPTKPIRAQVLMPVQRTPRRVVGLQAGLTSARTSKCSCTMWPYLAALAGVWVRDTTPPRMTFVRAEGISQDSLQVTLQLDEPGTVWCPSAGQITGQSVVMHC